MDKLHGALLAGLCMSLALAASAVPAEATNFITQAGPDQTADRGDTVTLDGSWSFGTAANVLPTSSTWTQAAGDTTRATIADPGSLVTTFSTATGNNGSPETLTFTLTATYQNDGTCPSSRIDADNNCTHSDSVNVFLRPIYSMAAGDSLSQSRLDSFGPSPTATLKLSDRTYSFTSPTTLVVNQPLVIKGPAVIEGQVSFRIVSSDVTIENVTFRDIKSGNNGPEHQSTRGRALVTIGHDFNPPALQDITVKDSTFENTSHHAIVLWTPAGAEYRNISITGNTIADVGRNVDAPASNPADPADAPNAPLMTAIRMLGSTGGTFDGLYIQNNVISNPSFAGINLDNSYLQNAHVSGNTISDMLSFAIQKASRPARDYTGETVYIYENTISGANNALVYPKLIRDDNGDVAYTDNGGIRESVVEGAIIVWGGDNRHIKIYNNAVSQSRNGLVLCQGGCGVHEDDLAATIPRFTIPNSVIDHSIDVYGNSFVSNAGYDVVNLTPNVLAAGYNYWGDAGGPYASLAPRTLNSVNYLPSYADPQLQSLRLISSDLAANPLQQACSVTSSTVAFNIVTGGESVTTQSVTNVGNQPLTGIQMRAGPWLDPNGAEYGTLTTSVRMGGEFVDINPGDFVTLAGSLPAPGQSSDVEFKVEHTGRLLPPGESLSQGVSFFASCG